MLHTPVVNEKAGDFLSPIEKSISSRVGISDESRRTFPGPWESDNAAPYPRSAQLLLSKKSGCIGAPLTPANQIAQFILIARNEDGDPGILLDVGHVAPMKDINE